MPQMADIIVKKADGTTNITFSALTPSSGDKVDAQWRSNSVSTSALYRPRFAMGSQFNGPQLARRIRTHFSYPVLHVVSGAQVIDHIRFDVAGILPQRIADLDITEAVHQHGNLLVSSLIRQAFIDGYAPS